MHLYLKSYLLFVTATWLCYASLITYKVTLVSQLTYSEF